MFQRHDLLSLPAAQPAAEGAGKKVALAALAALAALGALRVPEVRRLLEIALPRPPPLAPWAAGLVALPARSVLAGAAQPLSSPPLAAVCRPQSVRYVLTTVVVLVRIVASSITISNMIVTGLILEAIDAMAVLQENIAQHRLAIARRRAWVFEIAISLGV